MQTVTQWFLVEKPEHAGIYEREFESGSIRYSHWDGFRFALASTTRHGALANRGFPSMKRGLPWRGLAGNPAVDNGPYWDAISGC